MKIGKCFIYCRQSSGMEDSDESLSIQQQFDNCKACAEQNNLEVIGVFRDANVSGKTYPAGAVFEKMVDLDLGFKKWFEQQTNRKQFREGLGELMNKLHEVEYVVVDELTRLHRAAGQSFLENVISVRFREAGVKILQVKGGPVDFAQFDQNLIAMLTTMINDRQIANQKTKSKESRKRLRDNGVLCGAQFFGGIYDGNKNFHFDPEKAEVIKFIFESIAAEKSYSQLVYELNRDYRHCFDRAKACYVSTIGHIASQPIYAGYMYNSEGFLIQCANTAEPIISIELFDTVQKIIASKKKNHSRPRMDQLKKRNLPLSGFLRCGNCHTNMLVNIDNNKIFYVCPQAQLKRDSQCARNRIMAYFEYDFDIPGLRQALFPLFIIHFINRVREYRMYEQGRDKIEEYHGIIDRYKQKIQVAFDQFKEDIIDENTYRNITAETMKEIRQLKIKCLDIEFHAETDLDVSLDSLDEEFRQFINLRHHLDDIQYLRYLRGSVDMVTVNEGDVLIKLNGWGEFTLPRMNLSRKRRHLPRGTIRVIRHNKEMPWYADSTRFKVIFDYRLGEETKRSIQLQKILECGPVGIFIGR